jgi:hypothetical protein
VVSGEIFHLALHWLFGGSKWQFSVTRCRRHLIFRTPLRAIAGTLAHLFGPTSAGCTAKGGVSTSTACSVAVIEVHQPIFLSLDLNFAPTAYLRTDRFGILFEALCVSVTSRAVTYMLCAIGQCGVLGFSRNGITPQTRASILHTFCSFVEIL